MQLLCSGDESAELFIETIFEKNLFFLIPFHLFTYEQDFKVYEKNPQKLNELRQYMRESQKKLQRGDSIEKIADDLVEGIEIIKEIADELRLQ